MAAQPPEPQMAGGALSGGLTESPKKEGPKQKGPTKEPMAQRALAERCWLSAFHRRQRTSRGWGAYTTIGRLTL